MGARSTGVLRLFRGNSDDDLKSMLSSLDVSWVSDGLTPFLATLTKPVRLVPKETYCASLSMNPSTGTCSGYMGKSVVTSENGVTFTFRDASGKAASNGTSVGCGQFPAFHFVRCAGSVSTFARAKSAPLTVTRLQSHHRGVWGYSSSADSINFRCNKTIKLCGVGLYAGKADTVFTANLSICIVKGSTTQPLWQEDVSWSGEAITPCNVIFRGPVSISEGETYRISLRVTSPFASNYGIGGKTSVTGPDGTLFTFTTAGVATNGTCVELGQIPQLMYQVVDIDGVEIPDVSHVDIHCKLPGCSGCSRATVAQFEVYKQPDAALSMPKCCNAESCGKFAEFSCANCGENFGAACWPSFHAVGLLRLHVQLPATASQPARPFCTLHPGKPLDGFCTTDNTIICDHCLIYGQHRGHHCVPYRERAAVATAGVDSALSGLEEFGGRLRKSAEEIPKVKGQLRDVEEATLQYFKETRRKLHEVVDQRLDAFEASISRIVGSRSSALAGQQIELLALSDALKDQTDALRVWVSNNPAASEKATQAAQELSNKLASCKSSIALCTDAAVTLDRTWTAPILHALQQDSISVGGKPAALK
jgi:hypothetical protein